VANSVPGAFFLSVKSDMVRAVGSQRVAKFCDHRGVIGNDAVFAWSRGYSFLELLYPRADREFVMTLRRRVPRQDA